MGPKAGGHMDPEFLFLEGKRREWVWRQEDARVPELLGIASVES